MGATQQASKRTVFAVQSAALTPAVFGTESVAAYFLVTFPVPVGRVFVSSDIAVGVAWGCGLAPTVAANLVTVGKLYVTANVASGATVVGSCTPAVPSSIQQNTGFRSLPGGQAVRIEVFTPQYIWLFKAIASTGTPTLFIEGHCLGGQQ